jgi:hypothetical protein
MKVQRSTSITKKRVAIFTLATALLITFIPNSAQAVEAPLTLATASTYGVLANSAITTTLASTLTGTEGGNIGVGGGTAATGPMTYSGAQVLGGASLAALTSASTALSDNRGGTSLGVELGAGAVRTAGAYTGGTFEITGVMTLDGGGNPNAVFIFRAASTLVTAAGSSVVLTNGTQACNVFWQIGSSATLGASSTFAGHLIAQISIGTGATTTINGQLIAMTGAVTLGGTSIVNDSCATPAVVTTTETATKTTTTTSAVTGVFVETGTVRIIKEVVNKFGETATSGSFVVHVTQGGREVLGSPAFGVSDPGVTYVLPVGHYLVYEDSLPNYRGVWTGDVSNGGRITVIAGETITAVRTNYDMYSDRAVATPTPTPVATPTPTPTPTDSPVATPSPTPSETTATGEVLPDTATPWGNQALMGFALVLLGILGFSSRKLITK